jgi:carboxypeptidase family protein
MARRQKDIDLLLRRESNRAITIVRPGRSKCPSALLTSGRLPMPTLFLGSVVVALFLAVATPAAQQGTSEIRGRVVDQNGAVLPSVTVVLTNEDTGVFRETISGADGSYFATQLIPGRYRSISARTEIPKTGGATFAAVVRYMTGAPFTIFDSSIDARSERRAQRSACRRHLQWDCSERDS